MVVRRPRAGTTRQSLSKKLAELRSANVLAASFHPDGRLSSVHFGPDVGEPGETEEGEKITSGARRALEVLRGQRRSLYEEPSIPGEA